MDKLERKGLSERVSTKLGIPREEVLTILDGLVVEMADWAKHNRGAIELRGFCSIQSTVLASTEKKVFGEMKEVGEVLRLRIKGSKVLRNSLRKPKDNLSLFGDNL